MICIFLLSTLSYYLGAEFRNSVSYFSGNSRSFFRVQDHILFPLYEGFYIKSGFNLMNSVLFVFMSSENDENGLKVIAEPFFSQPEKKLYLHRFFSGFRYGILGLYGGRETVKLGPGIHNSLLLSHNISPQDFVALELKDISLPCPFGFCLGKLTAFASILFVNDESQKFPNPNFFLTRLDWKISFLQLGAQRIIAFDGRGGFFPKTFQDFLDLLTARVENAIGICEKKEDEKERQECINYWSARDTNQAAGVFGIVSFDNMLRTLGFYPDQFLFSELEGYFEYAGDDIIACWQVEDRDFTDCFPIPFGLTDVAWVVGMRGKSDQISFILEYTWTNKIRKFYAHGNYPLVVRKLYTGAHTGPLSDDIWLKVVWSPGGIIFIDEINLAGRFHFTRRWAQYEKQEKIFEFGPQITFDFDDKMRTFGFSFNLILSENPDEYKDPFSPYLREGKFTDILISVFFSSRF